MKKYSIIFFTTLIILFQTLGIGETAQISSNSSYYPITITNYNSQRKQCKITIEREPQRVFAYHQNNIELLIKLGLKDKLVGSAGRFVDEEKTLGNWDARLRSVKYMGLSGIRKEDVMFLETDIILGWISTFTDTVWGIGKTDFWNKRKVNCYVVANCSGLNKKETINSEYEYIRDIGRIFNRQKEAEKIIKEIDNEINYVVSLSANRPRQRVMLLDFQPRITVNYTRNKLCADVISKLGGDVINTKRIISLEDIIKADPDVIFVAYKTNEEINLTRHLLKNPATKNLRCVKNNRVYGVPFTFLYGPGVRLIDGIKHFSKGLYPDLNLDFKNISTPNRK
ncbi:MAG: ABC transporter substrate-binding protein [Synergistaceae bacterium]